MKISPFVLLLTVACCLFKTQPTAAGEDPLHPQTNGTHPDHRMEHIGQATSPSPINNNPHAPPLPDVNGWQEGGPAIPAIIPVNRMYIFGMRAKPFFIVGVLAGNVLGNMAVKKLVYAATEKFRPRFPLPERQSHIEQLHIEQMQIEQFQKKRDRIVTIATVIFNGVWIWGTLRFARGFFI